MESELLAIARLNACIPLFLGVLSIFSGAVLIYSVRKDREICHVLIAFFTVLSVMLIAFSAYAHLKISLAPQQTIKAYQNDSQVQ
jgi:uncharacterized UPF0146 family protein